MSTALRFTSSSTPSQRRELSSGRTNSVKYFGGLPNINVVHALVLEPAQQTFRARRCSVQPIAALKMPCYTHSIFWLSSGSFVVNYQIKLSRNSGWPWCAGWSNALRTWWHSHTCIVDELNVQKYCEESTRLLKVSLERIEIAVILLLIQQEASTLTRGRKCDADLSETGGPASSRITRACLCGAALYYRPVNAFWRRHLLGTRTPCEPLHSKWPIDWLADRGPRGKRKHSDGAAIRQRQS